MKAAPTSNQQGRGGNSGIGRGVSNNRGSPANISGNGSNSGTGNNNSNSNRRQNSINRTAANANGRNASSCTDSSDKNTQYGVIVSIKSTFGFIQTMTTEDQIYFGEREFYEGVKVGNIVSFTLQAGAGPTGSTRAQRVRHVSIDDNTVVVPAIQGTIISAFDRGRNNVGCIEINSGALSAVPATLVGVPNIPSAVGFLPGNVATSKGGNVARLDKGDLVDFSIVRYGQTGLFTATDVKFVQSRRDRAAAVQVERMRAAGVEQETGIVTSLKKGEYGFIRAATRKDEVYFRVDDVYEMGDNVLNEGIELEFFVIAESVKGKLSDRAIHLRIIPKGSVIFEYEVGKQVLATVVSPPGDDGSPGLGRLKNVIDVTSISGVAKDNLSHIELWPRCMPEELALRVGDVLQLDVLYYRPERLYFARSVKVHSYRQLGREEGYIVAVRDQGFGFIHSLTRNIDIYFKKGQVLSNAEGVFVPESSLQPETLVSFDISGEDISAAKNKLRAVRVQIVLHTSRKKKNNNCNGGLRGEETEEEEEEEANKYVLRRDVRGRVVRTPKSKESSGLLKISAEDAKAIRDAVFFNPSIVSALEEFMAVPEWREVSIYALPTSSARQFYNVLDGTLNTSSPASDSIVSNRSSSDIMMFPGVVYENLLINDREPSAGRRLVIRKVESADYSSWLDSKTTSTNNYQQQQQANAAIVKSQKDHNFVEFFKEDYESSEWIPLSNDLHVRFNLCWDNSRNRKIARAVRLTDEAAPDNGGRSEPQQGIVDMAVEKNGCFGFIRCLPFDEKLFYHIGAGTPRPSDLHVGGAVSFRLRVRGGLRCATEIVCLPAETLQTESELSGECYALVVGDGSAAVLVDANGCGGATLYRKFIGLPLLSAGALADQHGGAASGAGKKESSTLWDKKSVDSAAEQATVAATATSEGGGSGYDEDEAAADAKKDEAYLPKYYPPLPRIYLPLKDATGSDIKTGTGPAVGSVVRCKVAVNWAAQRQPMYFRLVSTTTTVAACKRGRIVRSKFRLKLPPSLDSSIMMLGGMNDGSKGSEKEEEEESISAAALGLVDLVEIFDLEERTKDQRLAELSASATSPANSAMLSPKVFYCRHDEVTVGIDAEFGVSGRDGVQNGSEVEFWTVPSLSRCMAFNVSVIPGKMHEEYGGITFKKRPIVAAEGITGVKPRAPLNLITMAEGSPNDAAIGFAENWRAGSNFETLDVASLPWSSLLTHLVASEGAQ